MALEQRPPLHANAFQGSDSKSKVLINEPICEQSHRTSTVIFIESTSVASSTTVSGLEKSLKSQTSTVFGARSLSICSA